MSVTERRSDDISAGAALDRLGLGCSVSIGCMGSLACFDNRSAAVYGADMPVVCRVRLPLRSLGVSERFALGSTAVGAGLGSNTGCRNPAVGSKLAVLDAADIAYCLMLAGRDICAI